MLLLSPTWKKIKHGSWLHPLRCYLVEHKIHVCRDSPQFVYCSITLHYSWPTVITSYFLNEWMKWSMKKGNACVFPKTDGHCHCINILYFFYFFSILIQSKLWLHTKPERRLEYGARGLGLCCWPSKDSGLLLLINLYRPCFSSL